MGQILALTWTLQNRGYIRWHKHVDTYHVMVCVSDDFSSQIHLERPLRYMILAATRCIEFVATVSLPLSSPPCQLLVMCFILYIHYLKLAKQALQDCSYLLNTLLLRNAFSMDKFCGIEGWLWNINIEENKHENTYYLSKCKNELKCCGIWIKCISEKEAERKINVIMQLHEKNYLWHTNTKGPLLPAPPQARASHQESLPPLQCKKKRKEKLYIYERN